MSNSSTTTEDEAGEAKLPPIHPGEFLREDFLIPLGITPEALAEACGASPELVAAVAREEALLTGELALRLARYFNTSAGLWMNWQARYELEKAEDAFQAEIKKIQPRPLEAAE